MQCIDLLERLGNTYRIEDEAGGMAGRRRRQYEPWGLVLPSSQGHTFPIGGDHLGASTNRRGPVANRIASIPGVVAVQDGSDGVNLEFHINDSMPRACLRNLAGVATGFPGGCRRPHVGRA